MNASPYPATGEPPAVKPVVAETTFPACVVESLNTTNGLFIDAPYGHEERSSVGEQVASRLPPTGGGTVFQEVPLGE